MSRKSARPEPSSEPLQDYGCPFKDPPGDKQLFFDRYAFAFRVPIDRGAPTCYKLFRRISDKLVPGYLEWHEWTERAIGSLCDYKWVGWSGCAGSAKTFNAVAFACTWWLCYPEESSVILCSTTAKSLRKRGWAEVQRYHTSMANGERYGNFVDSKLVWQVNKGDDKHAIVGIAVEEGATVKVADNIKGIHTRRQMVVIDEGTSVPAAIFEACTNLYAVPEEFILLIMGNPRSRLDQMGKFCEPLNGWTSINVESEEWETKPQIDGQSGIVIRFDAEKSPNIKEGKLVSRYLPTKEKVDARRKALGGENDPSYWSNERGFWAPEGITKTVFTESALVKHDGYGKFTFTGRWLTTIGAFDPAYGGGDRPALRFAKLGEVTGGKWGVQLLPPIIIPINAHSNNPIHYQLTEQVRLHCERFIVEGVAYSCSPENLAVDDTGAGGIADIMQRTWNARVIRIEFGGRPSEETISPEDQRLAFEVYRNKATEMQFRARTALDHGQLKGFESETAVELCNREYDDSKALIKLEAKSDYKARFGKSPDFGDATVMLLEVARMRGFKLAPIGETMERYSDFEEGMASTQAVFEHIDYEEPDDEEGELAYESEDHEY